jgi:hypothetical protein
VKYIIFQIGVTSKGSVNIQDLFNTPLDEVFEIRDLASRYCEERNKEIEKASKKK